MLSDSKTVLLKKAGLLEVFGNLPRQLPHLNQLQQALVTRVEEIQRQIQKLPPES